jgi:MFS family permease
MAPNLTEIAEEFGFDDEERDRKLGGDISLAFFLLGAPASMVIGCLTDSSDRSVLFAWTVFIGEGACFLTYWVTTYPQLYVCRAITGFSVGGAVPLIYSVLGDLFAADDRHLISALVSSGTGAGIAVGQAVAGFFGPVYGWRLPFLLVSIPALITAALVLFTVPDPERGTMETSSISIGANQDDDDGVALVNIRRNSKEHEYHDLTSPPDSPASSLGAPCTGDTAAKRNRGTTNFAGEPFEDICDDRYSGIFRPDYHNHLGTMAKLLSTPTIVLAIIQGAPGCVTWGIINVFLNDFLSEDRGFTVQMATTTLMFFSVGNGVGLFFLGGGLGQRLYRVDRKYPAILAGASAIFGCVPLWMLFNWVDVATPYWHTVAVAFLAGFGSGPTGPIIKATLTNVTHPRARGQAFAFFNLFDDFGKGLGPFFVSLLISGMGGRLPAFNVGILGWAICGLANLAVYFSVESDEARMQTELIVARSEEGL